jgi:predicted enzyme related to lactoylglutathione lyase
MSADAPSASTARPSRPGKFVWFEHLSADPKKAQEFYARVLDWKHEAWNDSGYEMIFAGDTMDSMVGGYGEAAPDQPAHWISYVSVEDVDAAVATAAANGGTVVQPPQSRPGVGRSARIADAQGAELCLFKSDSGDPPDSPSTEPPPLRRFFWAELHTTDADSAVSFYENVVGYTHETVGMAAGDPYHILYRAGMGRGGISGHLGRRSPHWLPYVSVADADATIERARQAGGTIRVEPMDLPGGVGRFGVFEDPTGAVLAVMKAMPPST